MNPSTLDLLCMLGDKAVYVLMLMISIGQPVMQNHLEAITGYSPNILAKALTKLDAHRVVSRTSTRGTWALTAYGQQLRLGETLQSSIIEGGHPQARASYPQASASYPQENATYPQRPSIIEGQTDLVVDSSTRSHIPLKEDDKLLLLDGEQPSRIEGRHPQEGATYPQIEENKNALADYGIEDPACSRLAALPHVTPRYIDAHCSTVLASQKDIALAIYRISEGWKAPKPVRQYLSEDGISRLYTAYLD